MRHDWREVQKYKLPTSQSLTYFANIREPLQTTNLLGEKHLRQNFICCQVSGAAHASCSAEFALLLAAYLCANTQSRLISVPCNDGCCNLQAIG